MLPCRLILAQCYVQSSCRSQQRSIWKDVNPRKIDYCHPSSGKGEKQLAGGQHTGSTPPMESLETQPYNSQPPPRLNLTTSLLTLNCMTSVTSQATLQIVTLHQKVCLCQSNNIYLCHQHHQSKTLPAQTNKLFENKTTQTHLALNSILV